MLIVSVEEIKMLMRFEPIRGILIFITIMTTELIRLQKFAFNRMYGSFLYTNIINIGKKCKT